MRRISARLAARNNGSGWRLIFLILATIGFCLSADLLRLHYNVHADPEYQSYCAMSERVNCNTVALSDYAVIFGLPSALWGMLAYFGFGFLATLGLRYPTSTPTWPFGCLTVCAGFASLASVIQAAISNWIIQSFCIVCAVTYVVNFSLLLSAWQSVRHTQSSLPKALREEYHYIYLSRRPFILTFVAGIILIIIGWVIFPRYWQTPSAAVPPSAVQTGVTEQGYPWKGSSTATAVIQEFSDYQCPYCERAHNSMKALVSQYPDKIQLIPRNYPLDMRCNSMLEKPFHLQACEYAMMAVCAQQQNLFWQTSDYLFMHGRRQQPITAEELANKIGLNSPQLTQCMQSDAAAKLLAKDIEAGQKLNIRGTPTFVLNGVTYPGRIPPEILERHVGKALIAD